MIYHNENSHIPFRINHFQTGDSRKKLVVEAKRAIVAASEERFQAEVFQMTTEDDMPEYSDFDNA